MIINSYNLLHCLQSTVRVLPVRSMLSILTGVSLFSEGDILFVKASDLEMGIEVQNVCQGEIETVLPGKLLFEIVSKFSDNDVEIVVKDNVAEIKCGRSYYKIPTMNYKDYPTFPEIESEPLSIPLTELKKAINQTLFAVSQDETRGALNGLCLNLTQRALKATDGHKYSKVQNLNIIGEGQYILPYKAAKELLKVNGEMLQIKVGEGQIEFIADSLQHLKLISRLIEGEFPNDEGIVSDEYETVFYFNYENLAEALKRISIMQTESALFNLKTKTLYAKSPEYGSVQEQIEFWFEKEGKLEKFSFNPKFLIDPLSVMKGGQVIIKANGELKPMVLEERENDDWEYLFMPLETREEDE